MKLLLSRLLFAISVFVCFALPGFAEEKHPAEWEAIDARPVPQWFLDAKFGIFIHWGVYSVPAWGPLPKDGAANIYECYSEHYWNRLESGNPLFVRHHSETYGENFKYPDFAESFKCEMFKPGEWAKIFRESGAKYVVLTSKHHDGYALWPSEFSPGWNASDTGPRRDLLGEITQAVKAEGLKMGYYYSLLEWNNPLYREDIGRYVDTHMLPQMRELVEKYEPEIFWPDGEWDHLSSTLKSPEFLAWLYGESPVKDTVVVNDRWGKETRGKHGGFYTTEYDLVHSDNVKDSQIAHPWEECRGIGHSFGYNKNENLEDYSTSEELVHMLVEKVAKGGNLLLNVGPTADGRIPVIMQQRLADIGKWLKVNGDAIYGTRPWGGARENAADSVYYTAKGGDLYVIFTKIPPESFELKGIEQAPSSASILGTDIAVGCEYSDDVLKLEIPALTLENSPCDYAWAIKISGCL